MLMFTKDFDIKVFSPPVSELLKRELGIEKGSGIQKKLYAGNASIEKIIKQEEAAKLAAEAEAGVATTGTEATTSTESKLGTPTATSLKTAPVKEESKKEEPKKKEAKKK